MRKRLWIFSAPLANRLGIWQIKWELEDLAFRYVDPEKYREIYENLAERQSDRERQMNDIRLQLLNILGQADIQAEITGAPKTYLFYIQENGP